MNISKDILTSYISRMQHPKLRILSLSILLLSQLALPHLFPFLKGIGLASPPILKLSAHILLLLTILATFYVIEWSLKNSSDLKCPYCGSFRFFAFESKTTGGNVPKGYIMRHYQCKDCNVKEKIFVKAIQASHGANSFN